MVAHYGVLEYLNRLHYKENIAGTKKTDFKIYFIRNRQLQKFKKYIVGMFSNPLRRQQHLCGIIFEHDTHITMHVVMRIKQFFQDCLTILKRMLQNY